MASSEAVRCHLLSNPTKPEKGQNHTLLLHPSGENIWVHRGSLVQTSSCTEAMSCAWSRCLSKGLVLDYVCLLLTHLFSASVSPQDRVDFLQLMIESQNSHDGSKSAETNLAKSMSRDVSSSQQKAVVP